MFGFRAMAASTALLAGVLSMAPVAVADGRDSVPNTVVFNNGNGNTTVFGQDNNTAGRDNLTGSGHVAGTGHTLMQAVQSRVVDSISVSGSSTEQITVQVVCNPTDQNGNSQYIVDIQVDRPGTSPAEFVSTGDDNVYQSCTGAPQQFTLRWESPLAVGMTTVYPAVNLSGGEDVAGSAGPANVFVIDAGTATVADVGGLSRQAGIPTAAVSIDVYCPVGSNVTAVQVFLTQGSARGAGTARGVTPCNGPTASTRFQVDLTSTTQQPFTTGAATVVLPTAVTVADGAGHSGQALFPDFLPYQITLQPSP